MIAIAKRRIGPLTKLSVILAGVVVLELAIGPLSTPTSQQVGAPVANSTVVASSAPPSEETPLSAFAEIAARPLFSQSRRPHPPGADKGAVPVEAQDAASLRLIGVITWPDGRVALLRSGDVTEVLRAVEGQTVGGWEVRSIRPTNVVLARGTQSEVVKLEVAKTSGDSPSITPQASSQAKPSVQTVTGGDAPSIAQQTSSNPQAKASVQPITGAEDIGGGDPTE
jgi:general secretion pathway protein N